MAETIPPPEAMRGISKTVFVATVVVVAVIAFVGGMGAYPVIYPAKAPPAGTPGTPLVIGTNTPFPPFESVVNGTVVGFDIDLLTTALQRLNKTYVIRDFRDFGALLSAVEFQGVDIAASAITSSGAPGALRNQTMSFSDPYFESDQAVLVRKNNNNVQCDPDPAGCSAANLANFTVAVQTGTTSEFWVGDNLPNATVSKFSDVTQVLNALQTSSVDIVVIDKPAGEGIVAGNNQFKVAGTIQTNELYSFAVAKGDPEGLLPGLNAQLAAMKTDGTYNQILDKWF